MGMFDYINVFMQCPFCGSVSSFDTQTKDLECAMFTYHPLPDDWFTSDFGKKFRTGLPVFPSFPLDKSAGVWESQAERTEARATIAPEFADQLKYVIVNTDCPKCKKSLDGKIRIQDGKLMGEIYDIDS